RRRCAKMRPTMSDAQTPTPHAPPPTSKASSTESSQLPEERCRAHGIPVSWHICDVDVELREAYERASIAETRTDTTACGTHGPTTGTLDPSPLGSPPSLSESTD